MSLAFIQQSAEHLVGPRPERYLFGARLALAVLLLAGMAPITSATLLLLLGLLILVHFDGPYNGGCDRLSLLTLLCVLFAHGLPNRYWQEAALGYLALQLLLSYWISGWVKIINPDWRSGRALRDVFAWSAYPVCENLRSWANYPRVLFVLSWAVMLLELLFPCALLDPRLLLIALCLTASFHLANALLFGLNRFVWIWIAGYPALIWLQQRLAPVFGQP
jgi:hypothetical protein